MISVNNSKLAPKKAPLANENIFIIAKLLKIGKNTLYNKNIKQKLSINCPKNVDI